MSNRLSIVVLIALLAVGLHPALANAQVDADTERLARWQLNNADLLVDEGHYLEAVEYIDSAYEISRHPKTRSDALLARAMVLATFLDAPVQAVDVYAQLAREFPEYAETAAYQSAFLLMQADETAEARRRFKEYVRQYPDGRYRYQAEAMLESMGEESVPPPAQPAGDKRPILRVLLAQKSRDVVLAAAGEGVCVDGMGCSPSLRVKAAGGAPEVNGRRVARTSFVVRSGKPISVSAGGTRKTVRGSLRIELADDRFAVLNLVDIESYLRSVVPAESYAGWPLETLKAQAVAARTYAYYQKLHRTSRPYDLRADTYDQMYGGVERETARSDQAVRDTAGQIITYGGRPILSQYTANSGGHTADAGAVFSASKPYLVAHPDPASLKGKMAYWKRSCSARELVAQLRKIGIDASGLQSIEPAVTGPSGRLIKVRLVCNGRSTVLRTRTTLASSRVMGLPEVLMRVEKQGDVFVFEGHGHGHGVGYSQWGSAELGKTWAYDRILAFYYPGVAFERDWD